VYATQFKLTWSLLRAVSTAPRERVVDVLELLTEEFQIDHFRVAESTEGLVITLFIRVASASAAEKAVEPVKSRLLQTMDIASGQ
jgi:hypothetical protein